MPHTQPAATAPNHTSSAVEPYFWATADQGGASVTWSPDLGTLAAKTPGPLNPDWDAWAQILAFGAPLAGRTPFTQFRRLQPEEEFVVAEGAGRGAGDVVRKRRWSWAGIDVDPQLEPEDLTDHVLTAIRSAIARLPEGHLNPMLSGGRDSRLLTALALVERGNQNLTAWTTSSDTGTSMEELVAARVARILEIDHQIIAPQHSQFAEEFADYARAVEYMSSFHVWLMPVARELTKSPGTILDGLGGGVILGGGFPDEPQLSAGATDEDILASRFTRMARYLDAAEDVFTPGVSQVLKERCWSDFQAVAEPFAQHPNGATLTAYLTRTLPGISMAPTRVLGSAQPTVMPIVDDDVVTAALQIQHAKKDDGAWYPHLLKTVDSRLTELPTAADLTRRRQHVRRGASAAAARWYRDLLLGSSVEPLLSERLRTAEIAHWSALLSKTKPQHLIRGLAMLVLWCDEYGERLNSVHPPYLEDAGV